MEEDDRELGTEEETLDHAGDDSNTADCVHEYRNSMQLHDVGAEQEHSSIETCGSLRGSCGGGGGTLLTLKDVSPIEAARARFLQMIVDHFIREHVAQAQGSGLDHMALPCQEDKSNKRKSGEVEYEGDPRFVLPLMYVANVYETLVNEANMRLASLNGLREKTIGLALEAAGGLYRNLAKKFPRKGPCRFKRRELATSLETRTRFPELVIQEEKRVRFVVVNGLDIVEKPSSMPVADAEWFKRLTGRNEVAISSQDYKFYSPRHKYRRVASSPSSSISSLPSYAGTDNSSPMSSPQSFRSINESQNQQQTLSKHHMPMQPLTHQPQFHSIQQNNQLLHQNQQGTHFSLPQQCGQSSQLPDISHLHQSPTIPQNMAMLQPLARSTVVGRLHMMPSPAKFCDECGTPYLRETSKFCTECGTKRLGI
ncbi:hypothetical protein Dimus_014394 [Dionaea muscipula]